jgi:hypothetical protein
VSDAGTAATAAVVVAVIGLAGSIINTVLQRVIPSRNKDLDVESLGLDLDVMRGLTTFAAEEAERREAAERELAVQTALLKACEARERKRGS